MFKIQIGDEVICKLNNRRYRITGATLFHDGICDNPVQIRVEDKNNNVFNLDEKTFNEMFTYGWSDWVLTTLKVNGNAYTVEYRHNNSTFEMRRMNNRKIVRAKLHPDDEFVFYKGLSVVKLRMTQLILREKLKFVEKQLKQY